MTNFIFILLFGLTTFTNHLLPMDHLDLLSMPIEGGEELSENSSNLTQQNNIVQSVQRYTLDEVVDLIDQAINTEYNKQTRLTKQQREEVVRGTRKKIDSLTRLNNYAKKHSINIISKISIFFYQEDLDLAISEGLFRKLRAKNPLFDQAINHSVNALQQDFTQVTPETLDLIDDPMFSPNVFVRGFCFPIKNYIMENAKNKFKTTNYHLQYAPLSLFREQSNNQQNPMKTQKPCHDLYLCLQATENTQKGSSLNYIYGTHQFKQLTSDQQNKIVRPEIEKRQKQLGYHPEKPLSPTY